MGLKDGFTSREYIDDIHPRVSRTFELASYHLSGDLEEDTKIGYLLCRVADTIEDTEVLSSSEKASYLEDFASIFKQDDYQGCEGFIENVLETASLEEEKDDCFDSDYWELVENFDVVMDAYREVDDDVRDSMDSIVVEMSEGMAEFEKNGSVGGEVRIRDLEEYEKYCHVVAGTVGDLMTDLFTEYGDFNSNQVEVLEDNSEDFGLALQTVNIIKDVNDDITSEDEYLWPETVLERNSLNHNDLKASLSNAGSFEGRLDALDEMIDLADNYLEGARNYIEILDSSVENSSFNRDMRNWAASTALMAEATMREVEKNKAEVFEGEVKISKTEVATIMEELDNWIDENGYRNVAQDIRKNEKSSNISLAKFLFRKKIEEIF